MSGASEIQQGHTESRVKIISVPHKSQGEVIGFWASPKAQMVLATVANTSKISLAKCKIV